MKKSVSKTTPQPLVSAPNKPTTKKTVKKHPPHQHLVGRFEKPMNELTMQYTASIPFDYRLAKHDIRGSLAHAAMLSEQGIISKADLADIRRGMQSIMTDIETGRFSWEVALEDVHMNIEKRLIDRVGDAGRRLHTGRSRNDQVATDIRLYLREAIGDIAQQLLALQIALADKAEANINTVMPGYTHLQVAQPIAFAHHLLAYFEMFQRDRERLADGIRRVNRMPLGAAALAGTTFPINRERTKKDLGFDELCHNSLDAVSDRDFAIEFLSSASIIMMHISRLSEEIILWMNPQFGFIDIADEFCTTSSIMPQKKNPDVPELARGKTGRVYGHLMALLTLMKAQPLAYNKDNQEDKEPLFDTVDTVLNTLTIFAAMIGSIRVRPEAMKSALNMGHAAATDLADHLVRQGYSFREAHGLVAGAVKFASDSGKDLSELTLTELKKVLPMIDSKGVEAMQIDKVMASRRHIGGTAPAQIRLAMKRVKRLLKKTF